jgi:hypothetical protein
MKAHSNDGQDATEDITRILKHWSYDENDAIRRITTPGGRDVLQVRLPLGIEQYELDGRPDGTRPRSQESWLHVYRRRARRHSPNFTLTERDVERLYEEGLLFYYRYLRFFQMQEYRLCARDTRRNIRLLEFVLTFGSEKQAEQLEQYRPYILRMNFMSRALWRLQTDNNIRAALQIINKGIAAVEELPTLEDNQVFEFEKVRSLQSLSDLHRQLNEHLPVPRDVQLKREMGEAVEAEDYERAARLRDALQRLEHRRERRKKKT